MCRREALPWLERASMIAQHLWRSAEGAAVHTTPSTLNPIPYTLNPAPYTLHASPCTLHPTPYTLHPTRRKQNRGKTARVHPSTPHAMDSRFAVTSVANPARVWSDDSGGNARESTAWQPAGQPRILPVIGDGGIYRSRLA